MNINTLAPLLKRRYRPIITCSSKPCLTAIKGKPRALVEGPLLNIEELNELWLTLCSQAANKATEEARPCPCVAGGATKREYGITILDVSLNPPQGVEVTSVLSAYNLEVTKSLQ